MSKSSSIISQSNLQSPNLELPSTELIKKSPIAKKKVDNDITNKKEINYFNIFKNLIIVTSIIFSFGGLGFGLGLRYGINVDIYQSKIFPANNFNSYD
ncbi:hypothetical protein GM3708_156 [Geminocystis sp. NIES-3708]|uniref:hypothetical protein n=1 Tax=Geminocystis sp. NIES-3708 TaxID=1615909 RepID=UPI0005FC6296|nr:hypothetical protein [Geminocystis sp. NIES-3708]BAQ59751.1 hypothetical protein GM3708_156 [Geminocystis sp. NIES-3708]